jgi:hypothetical protein
VRGGGGVDDLAVSPLTALDLPFDSNEGWSVISSARQRPTMEYIHVTMGENDDENSGFLYILPRGPFATFTFCGGAQAIP